MVESGELEEDGLADQRALFGLTAFFENEAHQVERLLGLARSAFSHDEKFARFVTHVAQPLLERGENLLVFTEYRATQRYLAHSLAAVLPEIGAVGLIHGSMSLDDKIESVRRFNAGETRVLVSTEAGGEGINLHQACHVMVNYDLPWNPSRLVQRIGRLYRYGQTKRVIVFNLMTDDGFDNTAIALMLDRVQTIARELAPVAGDQRETIEAEILGDILQNIDLEAILERATELRIELTQGEIDTAILQAREAQRLQDEIFDLRRQLRRWPRCCQCRQQARIVVRTRNASARWHEGWCHDPPWPGARRRAAGNSIGIFPEFGRRRHITLAFDRSLARDREGMFPVDFQSSFFQSLIALAKARAFDGLFASVASRNGPGWLAVYYLRWQNTAGEPLEDDILAIQCAGEGTVFSLANDHLSKLLLMPMTSARPVSCSSNLADRLRSAAEREVAGDVTRSRQPGSLFLLAAASLGGFGSIQIPSTMPGDELGA